MLPHRWYFSNVSIIFYFSMQLYYHSWMFYNHFIVILYHFLVLTYWHSAHCQFLFFPCFWVSKKEKSNGVQLTWKFTEIVFGPEEAHGVPEMDRRSLEATTRVGARPPISWPPRLLLDVHSKVSWIAFVPKRSLPKVSFRLDSVCYSFSAKHWNRQKTAICTGPLVSWLVPKII